MKFDRVRYEYDAILMWKIKYNDNRHNCVSNNEIVTHISTNTADD